jgi:hypothetical protein
MKTVTVSIPLSEANWLLQHVPLTHAPKLFLQLSALIPAPEFIRRDKVRVRENAVPAESGASWQNGMTGTVVDYENSVYLVRLSNGQKALFGFEELEKLQ